MKPEKTTVPLSVIISQEGKWFVAECPLLDLATQGLTAEEAKENMEDLIKEYFSDPDTPKPKIETLMGASVSIINIPVDMEPHGRNASAIKPE